MTRPIGPKVDVRPNRSVGRGLDVSEMKVPPGELAERLFPRVREWQQASGLPSIQVAQSIGLRVEAWVEITKGLRLPDWLEFCALAHYMGQDPSQLIAPTEEKADTEQDPLNEMAEHMMHARMALEKLMMERIGL